ncbi:hypothetical protein Kisp02_26960 [Kineosporia sp. NBRC 101731]|nr:hypothetical protein Kisp02_26960 [Kineosporia sp. NBRC 101731]
MRAPLRAIDAFSALLAQEYGAGLDEIGHDYLARVRSSAQHMAHLIDGLLKLAWVTHRELGTDVIDLSMLATSICRQLQQNGPERRVSVTIQPAVTGRGDPVLLKNVLENLLGNAWKFTSGTTEPHIAFGADEQGFFVRDNGAGFDMATPTRNGTPTISPSW